jgi:hypothetical protein
LAGFLASRTLACGQPQSGKAEQASSFRMIKRQMLRALCGSFVGGGKKPYFLPTFAVDLCSETRSQINGQQTFGWVMSRKSQNWNASKLPFVVVLAYRLRRRSRMRPLV